MRLAVFTHVAKYATKLAMSKKAPFAKFRKTASLTAEEAAELFRVNRATIFRWENGSPHIPVDRLSDAERITGMSRRELRPDIFAETVQ